MHCCWVRILSQKRSIIMHLNACHVSFICLRMQNCRCYFKFKRIKSILFWPFNHNFMILLIILRFLGNFHIPKIMLIKILMFSSPLWLTRSNLNFLVQYSRWSIIYIISSAQVLWSYHYCFFFMLSLHLSQSSLMKWTLFVMFFSFTWISTCRYLFFFLPQPLGCYKSHIYWFMLFK